MTDIGHVRWLYMVGPSNLQGTLQTIMQFSSDGEMRYHVRQLEEFEKMVI